jgi:hypothetical protein
LIGDRWRGDLKVLAKATIRIDEKRVLVKIEAANSGRGFVVAAH